LSTKNIYEVHWKHVHSKQGNFESFLLLLVNGWMLADTMKHIVQHIKEVG